MNGSVLPDRNTLSVEEFVKAMDQVFEAVAFPAVDTLYKQAYLTAKEAEELKIRRKVSKEINNVLCKHYTSVEGRLVYMRRPLTATIRFIFLCA
jgi:hypothetical protein